MANRSLNKVILIGNLTRDPELRYTPSGTAVCNFGLATNRSWVSSDSGQAQEETEFHRIVAWNKLAEICAQLLFTGRKVYVEGRLHTREWTTPEGEKRSSTEIVIRTMLVLDSKKRSSGGESGEGVASQPVKQPAGQDQSTSSGAQAKTKDQGKDEKKEAGTEKVNKKEEEKEKQTKAGSTTGANEEVKAEDIPF